jgi:predicted  nucleic acid-binding Zn-ribbon protein
MAQGFVTLGKPAPGQPQHEHSGGLFKHEEKKEPALDFSGDISNISRRLRVVEERNTNMQNRMSIIEQNMLSRHKQVTSEIKTLISENNELKKDISELKDRVLMLVKELQMSAKKEEITILKKYMELWEPANFVTHNEVQELIEEALNNRKV